MISFQNIGFRLAGLTLFDGVNLSVFAGEKIGLTGPNGAGKTTVFSLLLGERLPTNGVIQRPGNLRIGHLPQETDLASRRSLMEEVVYGEPRLKRLFEEKRRLEEENRAHLDRYGEIMDELEALGVYRLEAEAEKVLSGLGFDPARLHEPLRNFSGGWRMRALLARLLIFPYDLLLLDEPTNHLDVRATLWLKDHLARRDGTRIIISHDRDFLDAVTDRTMILENSRLFKVKGNYSAYERQRALEIKTAERKNAVIEKRRTQLERFARRFHAQPNRAAAVRNKRKMIERLKAEYEELPRMKPGIGRFRFPEPPPCGPWMVKAEGLGKRYGTRVIHHDLSFEIVKRQRIGIVGLNGAGKTTLLKILAGVEKADAGSLKWGAGVVKGYYAQSRMETLQPEKTVLEETAAGERDVPVPVLRNILGMFNFKGDDVFKKVAVLSGGEKSRLLLAKMLAHPPNLMLLDEPTTHLDIDGVQALIHAVSDFQGTVVFISHDLYFLRAVADQIWEVRDQGIKIYWGGLPEFIAARGAAADGVQQTAVSSSDGQKRSSCPSPAKKTSRKRETHPAHPPSLDGIQTPHAVYQDVKRRHNAAKKRLARIREDIAALEQQLKDLESERYAVSRFLANAFGKDPQRLKQYGRRLNEIPYRMREIRTLISRLKEEKDRILDHRG